MRSSNLRDGANALPSGLAFVASLVAGWLALAVGVPGVQATPAEARPKVALTFDDLPVHGALPAGMSRSDVARSILATLRAHKAPPVYGFVNAKSLDGTADTAEVLRLWRAAGQPLANHTFSHMDLSKNTAEAFEQDVEAGEPVLRSAMGGEDWHWLRFPYLHEGDTLDKRHAVRRFLQERGYRIAQVTMSFDDYAYNDPYARCLARDDKPAIAWLKDSYVQRAAESLSAGPAAARRVYGHDIAHVMLLHIGAFETVMLPRLLDLLDGRRFELVTLPQAESDPAYAVDPDVALEGGATLLEQMARAKGLVTPPGTDDALARLAGLCR